MCLLPNGCAHLCYSVVSRYFSFSGARLPPQLGVMVLLAATIQQAVGQVKVARLVKARLLKPSIS